MKKILLCLMLFINTIVTVANINEEFYQITNEKDATKMYCYYNCSIENKNMLKKCEHKEVMRLIFYNNYVFKKEFENNEQRAINMLKEENSIFFVSGKIKKLSSGIFNSAYIIELEGGVTIYLGRQFQNNENPLEFTLSEEQKKAYLNLNKGDYVAIISPEFLMNMHTGKTFMNALILDEVRISNLIKAFKKLKSSEK